jgi:hypothetical protein
MWRKPIIGAKAELLLQASFGFSVLIAFVVIPSWVEFLSARKYQNFHQIRESDKANVSFQELVYKKRLELRKKLEDTKDI